MNSKTAAGLGFSLDKATESVRQRGGMRTERAWLVKLGRFEACQQGSPAEEQDSGKKPSPGRRGGHQLRVPHGVCEGADLEKAGGGLQSQSRGGWCKNQGWGSAVSQGSCLVTSQSQIWVALCSKVQQ